MVTVEVSSGTGGDAKMLTVNVTLSCQFWDELTANLTSLDRDARGDLTQPDLTLDARIRQFLKLEIAGWEARGHFTVDCGGAPNGDVPF